MQVYTVKEVAELLSCSDGTVKRLIKDGLLDAVDLSPRTKHRNYRVTQSQLDAFLNTKQVEKKSADVVFRNVSHMGL